MKKLRILLSAVFFATAFGALIPDVSFGANAAGLYNSMYQAQHHVQQHRTLTTTDSEFVVTGIVPALHTAEVYGAVKSVVSEPYSSQEFRVTGTPTVNVRSTNGSITVKTGTSNIVKVEMYVTRRGLSILSSEKLGDDYRFVFRQRNNTVFAEVINLKGAASTSNMPVFDFVVYVPEKSNASFLTNFGDISISGVEGDVDARTSRGEIITERTSGLYRLSTTSGGVHVDGHRGSVFTNAIQGDVNYNEVHGETRIKVLSGNVDLRSMRGSVLVHCTNGNIDYTARMVDQLVNLESVVGNINVSLPGTGAFTFTANANQIDVDRQVALVGQISGRAVQATMNGGGVPVVLQSKVGQISIKTHR